MPYKNCLFLARFRLWRSLAKNLNFCKPRPRIITRRRIVHRNLYMQSFEYFGKAPVTRSESALYCGFFASMYCFADFFTLSQRFLQLRKKSITYVQDESFSGPKLTNLGKFLNWKKKNVFPFISFLSANLVSVSPCCLIWSARVSRTEERAPKFVSMWKVRSHLLWIEFTLPAHMVFEDRRKADNSRKLRLRNIYEH